MGVTDTELFNGVAATLPHESPYLGVGTGTKLGLMPLGLEGHIKAAAPLGSRGIFATPGGGLYNASAAAFGDKSVSGATQSGTDPVTITVTSHGFSTGDIVLLDSVGGATEVDGTWKITKVDANSFTLDGSDGMAITAYTSGGTARLYETWLAPTAAQNFIVTGLRMVVVETAGVLTDDGFLSTALTNGLRIYVQNLRSSITNVSSGSEGTDLRTAVREITPYAVKSAADLGLIGVTEFPLNSTDAIMHAHIPFRTPILLRGTVTGTSYSEYMALQIGDDLNALTDGDSSLTKVQLMAEGYVAANAA